MNHQRQIANKKRIKKKTQNLLRSAGIGPVIPAVFYLFLHPVLSSSSWNEHPETIPLLYQRWYFDFTFPISSLSHFDKVTSRCHLQYPAPFAQAHPNAVVHMKYDVQTEENISVYCSEIKPGLRCQLLSVSSRAAKKMKYLPQGPLIPLLFVLPLQFSKTRLSQLLLRPRTTRWKEKCGKSLFCLTSLIHSNRLDLLQ